MANRILWIDIAKVICIILVVIGHYMPHVSPDWYRILNRVIYTFHMPLFMFASGFVYIATKRETAYGNFLWKKVKRLMIPYLTVSIIVVSLKLITQGHAFVENPVTPLSYLRILYMPEAGYFLWFIWALWWMFVIIPLFKTPKLRLILMIISLLMPYISNFMPEEFCLRQCCQMMQYFVLGVIVYDWRYYLMWFKRVPMLVVSSCFVLGEVLSYMNLGGGILWLWLY